LTQKPDIYSILKKVWGFDEFRSLQEAIILSCLEGNNTLALLPTGGGKSLCYQLPGLALSGKTLVISPLIALMEDQVHGLKERGIRAIAVHGGMSSRDVDIAIDNWVHGPIPFLFIAPERINSPIFFERLKRVQLSLIAVDEAHCISQWGYDFRPSYFDIIKIKELFPKVPIIALTATATKEVVKDIIDKLGIKKSQFFQKSFRRSNLSISVLQRENKDVELLKVLGRLEGCGIIYQRNRAQTQYVAGLLAAHGFSVSYYHGGLDYTERKIRQTKWMKGEVQIIVCTNAFGMGIDKADVRFVIHLDIPPSLEEYYQEIGRAGRDGEKSHAVSILNKSDFARAIYNHQSSFAEIKQIHDLYHKLHAYLKVPVGSGEGEQLPFDISDFMSKVDFPARLVWNVFNYFEKEGLIVLSDRIKEPSSVWVTSSGAEINELLKAHPSKLRVLNQLLRMYEGLFLSPTHIDEKGVARKLGLTEIEIRQTLLQLHREGIILYKKASGSGSISLLKERLNKDNFSIDKKAYKLRKQRAFVRLERMIQFLNAETCRQVQVLDYFNEEGMACGICDNCLQSDSTDFSNKDYNDLKNHLFKYLGKQKIHVEDYIYLWPYNRRAKIRAVLGRMESEGELVIQNQLILPPQ
jgi:ATP-dependent DNA helicase RecQ